MKRKLANWVAWYMVTVMFLFGITPKVDAGFSPSEVIGQSQMDRSTDVEKIRKFLETKMIRERLHAFGFSQEEIQTRLNLLTDDQIHQVALKLDELKVAGDGAEAVIIALLIVAVVLLIFYLLGYRVVLKK
jgi:Family of unknown function (DUF6627)